MKRQEIVLIVCLLLAVLAFRGPAAQAASPDDQSTKAATRAAEEARKTAYYTARLKELGDELRSSKPDQNQQGMASLKEWMTSDPKEAAKAVQSLQSVLLWDPKYAGEDIGLLESVKTSDNSPLLATRLGVDKGLALLIQGKKDEATTALDQAFQLNPHEAAATLGNEAIKQFQSKKRYDDVLDLTQRLLLAVPETSDVVDRAIKARVAAFNSLNKPDLALAEIKRLFNACPMDKTNDVLLQMDHQLTVMTLGADDSIVTRFHKEQTAGAQPSTQPTDPGVVSSSVVGSIKLTSEMYDAAIKTINDDSFDGQVKETVLMLLANHAEDALRSAKRAYAQADNPPQTKTAADLVARCMKAQDGTVGRANAWYNARQPAKPKPENP